MKITMYPAKAMGTVFDAPAPFIAGNLDPFKQLLRDKFEFTRIVVDHPHDALTVAHKVADAPGIEGRGIEPLGMDFCKVVGERQRTVEIQSRGLSRVPDPLQIFKIPRSLRKFREQEELFGLAGRHDPAGTQKSAAVNGANMAGKVIERGMLPEYGLGPVGKVVMAVRGWGHGLEHGFFPFTGNLVFQKKRRTVPESLEIVPLLLGAMTCHGNDAHGLAIERLEIFSKCRDGKSGHGFPDSLFRQKVVRLKVVRTFCVTEQNWYPLPSVISLST